MTPRDEDDNTNMSVFLILVFDVNWARWFFLECSICLWIL
jgi:hypothetical protein